MAQKNKSKPRAIALGFTSTQKKTSHPDTKLDLDLVLFKTHLNLNIFNHYPKENNKVRNPWSRISPKIRVSLVSPSILTTQNE